MSGDDGAGGERSLTELAEVIHSCRSCPRLVAWREHAAGHPRASYASHNYWARPLSGFGDPDAKIAVVGLAPAAHGGNRTGRMFTGDRSGDWLFRAMWRAGLANQPTSVAVGDGLALSGAWVSAVVRCAPPDNRPTPQERDACLGYLADELSLLKSLSVIVALGRFAFDNTANLLGMHPRPRFAPMSEHAAVGPSGQGITLLASYHPSQRNTFTGLLTEPMFDAVFERAAALAQSTPP